MAQAPVTTEKKKRKAFTRTEKPVYMAVRYKDEQGNNVKLDKSRLSVTIHRDADEVLELQESSGGEVTIQRVTLPKATKPAAPANEAAAA